MHRALVVAVAGAAVMAAAQIAIPLTTRRAGLSTIVVVALAVAAAAPAVDAWSGRRAAVATAGTTALALIAEVIGVHTGWPFGRYHYTGILLPTLAGVPVIVPLAWTGMALAAREVAARVSHRPLMTVLAGAGALTAWDLFLDPQMTHEHYWVWAHGGPYRGIPLSNFAGWLACSVVVMAALVLVLGAAPRSGPLAALYAWMAVMETIGFLFFFGAPVVAVVGGAAMLPVAVQARHA